MGFIAIHSTSLGPAFGGARLWSYDNEAAALSDALRLSEGMSYKNALADLSAGGGKSVLWPRSGDVPRERLFSAFGQAIEALGGRYITAEDVGTTVADMETVRRQTRYVAGLPVEAGRAGRRPVAVDGPGRPIGDGGRAAGSGPQSGGTDRRGAGGRLGRAETLPAAQRRRRAF